MRFALMGDIHGNAHALEAVLKSVKRRGVDKLLITGDLIGYYYEPRRVLEQLESWSKIIVKGNHESMISRAQISESNLMEIERRYGKGLRRALDELKDSQLEMLKSLPLTAKITSDDLNVLLCHGTPQTNEAYIYPDAHESVLNNMSLDGFDYVVMGHTHYPMLINGARNIFINPGSVGQPRNRVQGAHWAILDTETRLCEFYVEDYDFSEILEMCFNLDPHLTYLVNVLKRTK